MRARQPSGGPVLTPSRLTLARKRRGLTLVQLATEVGVSVRSLSAYENGRQEPAELARRLASTAWRTYTETRAGKR